MFSWVVAGVDLPDVRASRETDRHSRSERWFFFRLPTDTDQAARCNASFYRLRLRGVVFREGILGKLKTPLVLVAVVLRLWSP